MAMAREAIEGSDIFSEVARWRGEGKRHLATMLGEQPQLRA
jgi:hypothetical protein